MNKRDKKQLLPGIVIAIAIAFLVFLYAPVDLYCSNISEFWFDFGILIRASLGLFLISAVILSLAYVCLWLIHPVLYRIGLTGGFLGLLCTYIQGNFLVKNLPPLDGTSIHWEEYTVLRTEDFVLWGIGSIVAVLMYIFLKKDMLSKTVMYLSGGLTLMLLITAVSVVFTSGALQEKVHYQYGADKEFVMSEDQNFVILLLDTVDSRTVTELLADHPEYNETFRDFTYFENTVGAYSCTERSVPYILSGEWYENDEPFDDYMKRMYQVSPLFNTLQERGYNMELCDPELYMDDDVAAMFSNIHRVDLKLSSYTGFAKPLLKLIGFRYAPFELKKKCTFKTAAFAELITVENISEKISSSELDHIFKGQLDTAGITTEDSSKKFKFIHLNGAHVPYIYDKEMNIINEWDGTYEQSTQATLFGAMDYVEQLRESGAYDNTTIIVMSDHGFNGSLAQSGDATWMRQCAMLLVKGRNEHHDTMQISQAPISFEDLQEAYVRLLDGQQSDSVFDWKEGDVRERRFLRYSFLDDSHMQEYMQTGYASDMDTMILTGREYNR